MTRKLLIANRGEIACRVARTARRLGIATVAVYSDADAAALHVETCDEALRIGPAPARESYLDADAILDAARATGADAIHPGYGFLAENAAFAEACRDAGLVFVGPPAAAIRAMGDKAAAIRAMREAGVPVLPGFSGEDASDAALAGAAAEIGFPVIVKPSAGGGGKGMRIVREPGAIAEAIAGARREAASSFASDALLLERYLDRPRHVEVQVFADRHGDAVHLFERDCSVQRRHQKVLEEAPAPGLGEDLRDAMGEVAVRAARAIGYEGAGTVEFLLDSASGEFYFMEMNTRLQVEHPVTEMVCRVDLVEWQLRVADGEPLPLEQDAIARRGHAFEARVYAESPERGFLPAAGTLDAVEFPPGSDAVRVDTGVRAGDAVGVHYDPMIAKLVVHGADRARALAALRDAIAASTVTGVATNLDLLGRVAAHPEFARGSVDTGFVEREAETLAPAGAAPDDVLVVAALRATAEPGDGSQWGSRWGSPWDRLRGWRLNASAREHLEIESGSERLSIAVERDGDGWRVALPSGPVHVAAVRIDGDAIVARRGTHALRATARRTGGEIAVTLPSGRWTVRVAAETEHVRGEDAVAGHLTAPMPGTVTAVSVTPGDRVEKGQALVVLEAMKMEHTIRAHAAGTVDVVHFRPGDLVAEGAELVSMTPDETAAAPEK